MNLIKIRTPIWATRSIGVDELKLATETHISINYTNREGDKLYPNLYAITKERAMTYPVQYRRGVRLRIIPIFNLDVVEYR